MSLSISLQEKNEILELYGLIDEILTPLQKLSQCRFSEDFKYVVYEGKTYSTETGQEEDMILTEGWSLSDILHTGADIASAGMDWILPGTGAIIDILNALSYVIEAQFKSGEEKDSLYLMAAITFAFVLIPGPLQGVAPALKKAVATGVGFTSKVVVKGIKIIANVIDFLLLRIPSKIAEALKSPLAKRILGKWRNKINDFISAFTTRIKKILEKFKTPTAAAAASKSVKSGLQTMSIATKNTLSNFFKRIPKISKGSFLLRKLGFVAGKPYRYVGKSGKAMTATIKSIDDTQVIVLFKQVGTNKVIPPKVVSINTFVENAVGAPWMRRGYSVLVPLFIKRLADYITSNGEINYDGLAKLPDIDPNLTSAESLAFLQEEVASYEGEIGKYTVNTKASSFQNALIALGYPLPKFGADGKFGPETQGALKKFQQENGLTTSLGKMDRLTARKLAELLKSKNKPDTDELQKTLNTI